MVAQRAKRPGHTAAHSHQVDEQQTDHRLPALAVQQALGRPSSLNASAVVALQRVAGNQAVALAVQRMCGTEESKLVIEDSALKHKAEFAGGVTRLPTPEDVKRVFHASMKYGQKDLAPDERDPTSMRFKAGSNKLVFKNIGGTYHIYHFHTQSYSGDRR